jgi:hypothetical protein
MAMEWLGRCDLPEGPGNATLMQQNGNARQTAPELSVLRLSAAANSPSTGSAYSAIWSSPQWIRR